MKLLWWKAILAIIQVSSAVLPKVKIKNGTISGVELTGFEQHAFLGIPFAEPPLGDLRLRRPQPFSSTLEGFAASDYSPICYNAPSIQVSDGDGIPQSEDCLTLNIIRPAQVDLGDSVPVMLWIYGGALTHGGSAIDWYNGTYLVQASQNLLHPIIFVSINYRLSQLGFLAGRELAEEGNLNLGFYDQRLAMHWVQENIAAFGGDPSKVTIFGESSGGISVGMHYRAFGGRDDNLFRAGISQSGSGDVYLRPTDAPFQASYDQLVANTTCRIFTATADQLACLRHIPVDEFRFAVQNWVTAPTVDGDIITLSVANPIDAYRDGLFVKRPLITGATSDEGTAFIGSPQSREELVSLIETILVNVTSSQIQTLFELYPEDPFLGVPYNTGSFLPSGSPYFKQGGAIIGDAFFVSLRRYVSQQLAAHHVPIWTYRFNQIPLTSTDADGVTHFSEVLYMFGNPNCPLHQGRCLRTRALDLALSASMQSMWISFATFLDPNKIRLPGTPRWPDYSENTENLRLQNGGLFTEKDDFRKEGIQFLLEDYFTSVGPE